MGGIDYYYYQTEVKIINDSKNDSKQIVRTEVGTRGSDLSEFDQRRYRALEEHGKKINSIWREENVSRYNFENKPEFHSTNDLTNLELNYNIFIRELSLEELKEFEQVLFIRYVYGTTALEGNTYTELETARLLNSGKVSAIKSPTESTEIINFNKAREFVKRNVPISEHFIKDIHAILMKGIKKPNGKYVKTGEYRNEESKLNNIWFTPCAPEIIKTKMKYLIQDYYAGAEKYIHPVELACIFHQRFEEIHPFEDGNGRTGREILNYMLRISHFPQIYIPPSEHDIYFYSLSEGNKPNYSALIDFVIHRMYQSMMYFMTKTGMSVGTFSEEFKGFYEATAGKEEFKKFVKLIDEFDSRESFP